MNPMLWDGYQKKEINDKVRYWVDLWESLIESLDDPSTVLRFELLNPHLLVRHILDEITFNNLQNSENRSFFCRKLEFFLEHDPATQKLFAADIALVRREFGGNRLSYLAQLCQSIDQAYTKSSYLNELYTFLRSIFDDAAWGDGDADSIGTLSQCMIVELLLRGYSLDTVKRFPESIFDRSTGLYFNQQFRPSLNEVKSVASGQPDIPAYRAAVQSQVDEVTLEQRLNLFTSYFTPRPQEVFFLYQLEGLKGNDLDITLGNVNLYSPKVKRYIKANPGVHSSDLQDEELFGSHNEDHCFANAAVKLTEFDSVASEAEAIGAIESALDLFRAFVLSDVKVSIVPYKFIRVSPDGDFWGGGERGRSRTDPAYKHFRSLDFTHLAAHGFDQDFLSSAGALLLGKTDDGGIGQKLSYSLHWYRKAEEAEAPEDRLLGYWIVLENIVSVAKSGDNALLPAKHKETKFAVIRELIPCLECCLYVNGSASMLFGALVRLLSTSTNGRPHLVLSPQVAAASQLSAPNGSAIDLNLFISHLPQLADEIERRTVRDQVLQIHDLHSDVQSAKAQIQNRLNTVKENLLLIYWLRNRIVHNAHYDNRILPYYVETARQYAGDTIRQVLHDICTGREKSSEQSLMRYYVQFWRIEERLSKGSSVDFLNLEL